MALLNEWQFEAYAHQVIRSNEKAGWMRLEGVEVTLPRIRNLSGKPIWCALQRESLYLFNKPEPSALLGVVALCGVQVTSAEKDRGTGWFRIRGTHPTKRWEILCQAETGQEFESWMFALSRHSCFLSGGTYDIAYHQAVLHSYQELFKAEVKWRLLKRFGDIDSPEVSEEPPRKKGNGGGLLSGRSHGKSHSSKQRESSSVSFRPGSFDLDTTSSKLDPHRSLPVSAALQWSLPFAHDTELKNHGLFNNATQLEPQESEPQQDRSVVKEEDVAELMLLLEEDSPALKQELRRLDDRMEELQANMKKLMDIGQKYLRAGHTFLQTGKDFADAMVKLAPPDNSRAQMIGYHSAVRKFVETFRQHHTLDEVKLIQLQESFITPLRKLTEVEIKEAKIMKQRLERARDRYNNALSHYLQLSKETDKAKLQSAEADLRALDKAFKALRVDSLLQLQDLDDRKTVEYLDQLATFMYLQQAFCYSGHEMVQETEPYVAIVRQNLKQTRIHLSDRQRTAVRLFEERQAAIRSTNDRPQSKPYDQRGWTHKEGYLLKRSSNMRKDWKRRWFTLDGSGAGSLTYRGVDQPSHQQKERVIKLMLATVRTPHNVGKRFCFELVCMSPERTYMLQASNQTDMEDWIMAIQNNIGVCLGVNNPTAPPSAGGSNSPGDEGAKSIILSQVREIAGNARCADCGASEPDWISLNLVVVICIECAGIHRGLGVHVSKMRSMTLDALDDVTLRLFEAIGNEKANCMWEADIEKCQMQRPSPSSTRPEKEAWIRAKYEARKFVIKEPRASLKRLIDASSQGDVLDTLWALITGADVNGVIPGDRTGRTAAHCAAAGGHDMIIELLFHNGALLDIDDSRGDTPLHAAVRGSQPAVEDLLRAKKVDVSIRNSEGLTPDELRARLAHMSRCENSASAPPPLPPLPPISKSPRREYVTALYAYEGAETGDLNFQVGDKIAILCKDPSGWWEGELNNQRGLFPANYTDAEQAVS